MKQQTNNQKMALMAYQRICDRRLNREFISFAREFPSLIHSCGLAQAVAFARAKQKTEYLGDLAAVLAEAGNPHVSTEAALNKATREHSVTQYVRLSRHALQAAGWLKRYVEAVGET